MTLEEELQLVEDAKTNIQAYAKIYDLYFDQILSYCINRLNSREMAEDVTSFVFMKGVEEIKKFNTSKRFKFSSWLYRAAHNKIIDIYRSNAKRKSEEIDDETFKSDENLDDEITQNQRRIEIADTLKELNDRYQQVISLRFFSELELDEIAVMMDVSKNNVSVLLNRALKAFKDIFEKKFPESEIFSI